MMMLLRYENSPLFRKYSSPGTEAGSRRLWEGGAKTITTLFCNCSGVQLPRGDAGGATKDVTQ